MQVSGQPSPNQPNLQAVPRIQRAIPSKVPDAALSQESLDAVTFQTKKDEAALMRAIAAKGGRTVNVNGEQRIQIGGDQFRSYAGRKGYDENFLGQTLELPSLDPSLKDKAAPRIDDPSRNELEYSNFSIVMNKERRMPFFTAVNIDGSKVKEIERGDNWLFDARIAREHQLGNEAYKNNPLDKGHMVRRRDASWGNNEAEATQGSTDTFAYTNAALQHEQLNQHEWLDLEDRTLNKAQSENRRMTVFTGPVFSDSDPEFNNNGRMQTPTKIPQEFWKVMVWNDPEKGLQSEAYVMSQKKDLAGQSGPEDNPQTEADFAAYRVSMDQLQQMTKLNFGRLGGQAA